jgi:hypothetical protein
MVADLATVSVELMAAGVRLIEAFTKLIVQNKPLSAAAPSPLLVHFKRRPAGLGRPPPERAVFHKTYSGGIRVSGCARFQLSSGGVVREVSVDGGA